MKKVFIAVAAIALLASCDSSKKGAWSKEEKDKASAEMKKIESSLDALGDKKQQYIDCYLGKIEDNYNNFDEANKDQKGCEKLAMECANDVILGK